MMDFANAAFNAVAAAFVIINAIDILKRRDVAGHTYPSTVYLHRMVGFQHLLLPWPKTVVVARRFIRDVLG